MEIALPRHQLSALRQKVYSHKLPAVVIALIALLIVLRLALPFILKDYINKTLAGIKGYTGHVERVHVAIWRGAYEVENVEILKKEAKATEPFIAAERVTVAIDWPALLRGHLKSKINFYKPVIQLIKDATPQKSQTSVDPESWQEHLDKLYPFDINQLHIYDGVIRFINKTSDPKINFVASKLALHAENISNTKSLDSELPSSVELTGLVLNSGKLNASAKFNLLSEPTEMEIKAAMRGLKLKEINDFSRAYGKFDFEEGSLDVALELAASTTNYTGYVKTALIAPKVLDWSKEKKQGDSTGHLIWEGVAGTIIDLFKNHNRNQFAAKIPLSGSRQSLKVNSWAAVGSIFKNAFIKALNPGLEDSVHFSDAEIRSGTTSDDSSKQKSKDNVFKKRSN